MARVNRIPVLSGPPSILLHRKRMMEEGWIKLHRKAKRSQVFKNAYLWQIWSWCLMEATHTEIWIPVKTGRGITEVHLLPGQFIFGRESAAKELRMKPSTIWKRMLKLKNIENLNIESNSKYSIITLTNWELYQDSLQKVTAKVTAKEQPSNTNKNDKNKNNILNQWFEWFWDEYPKKVGKKNAREKFLRFSLNEKKFQEIMEALRIFKQTKEWKKDGGQFIPHPATWIHQERWNDEVKPSEENEPMRDYIGNPL